MSSTTPDISSIPVQLTINSFTCRIVSDDGNDSMNEALDATNGNTDKTPVIDANDRECDNADPEECEEKEEGFNMMQKRGMPEWEKVSRNTIKKDCMQVYEAEKKKLKALLKTVSKISLTTDLWKSSNQKIEYMVLTAHFVDSNWRLQKHVISFVHIPHHRRSVEITDCIFKCLKEWGIKNKVFTLSVDNASSNDVAIKILKDTFSRNKMLLCGGKLFHVRCCAHILNLMVQDGLSKIKNQLQLPDRKLILDCKTRWNSTFEMLSIAIKFKEVFLRLKERESHYECCPSHEDWKKVKKVCEILEVFNSTTKIIFGSDYPTSNLFLNEVYRVKVLLDKRMNDENEFVQAMVRKMKSKFDKYWGECNLLMSIAAILDPRCKIRIYDEYAREYQFGNEHSAETQVHDNGISGMNIEASSSGWFEFANYVKSVENAQPQQSDLDVYLAEGCFICEGDSTKFHALEWWKASTLKIVFYPRWLRIYLLFLSLQWLQKLPLVQECKHYFVEEIGVGIFME
ncbi:zinc finger BED domain-containing protein RICESLEEPER 2-like [Durio zibethinus]|uniref:Zinc finger BED domain-containing protein RICESLEEPER 2-like n=1 Tax=Durio zibethinus TaxID=66656 RepID=A0A6P5Y9Q9_DURZI|nr:zinc finger BED domain-containing protein RICESLEEPER 2-like [Durio zibethinus]